MPLLSSGSWQGAVLKGDSNPSPPQDNTPLPFLTDRSKKLPEDIIGAITIMNYFSGVRRRVKKAPFLARTFQKTLSNNFVGVFFCRNQFDYPKKTTKAKLTILENGPLHRERFLKWAKCTGGKIPKGGF